MSVAVYSCLTAAGLVAGLAPRAAGQVYSIDNSSPHRLVSVNATTGAVAFIGPVALAGGASPGLYVSDMEFFSGRLYATFSDYPGGSRILELDPASGAVLSAAVLRVGLEPLVDAVEGLGADRDGLILSYWRPGLQTSTSGALGRVTPDGSVVTLLATPSDIDGMCFDPATGRLVCVDRNPGPDTNELFEQGIAPAARSSIVVRPFDSTVNGIDEPALLGGRVVSLDSLTKRVHQFSRTTGELLLSVPYDPAYTLHALAARPCLADLGRQGGLPGADGTLDNNDFIVFIDYFFAMNTLADRGVTGGVPGSDGLWDNNDFVVFIDQFFGGCG